MIKTLSNWFNAYPTSMVLVTAIIGVGAIFGFVYMIVPGPPSTLPTPVSSFAADCSDGVHTHITRLPTSSRMEAVCPANSDFTLLPTSSTENVYFICKCK